ncbi:MULTISPECIES: nucleotidyltransferase domain-containing protein [Arsenicicoccus]|uniref:nucleotidyltransferase domain-containing protein n=1 Tax=Arsenicicoccus TaxID=267408 RepID=UPI00257D964B|nr:MULTISPECIES: nucleotidyltransferase [Arsenicicoccus]
MPDMVFDAFKAFDKKLKLDREVTDEARSIAATLETCLHDAGLCQSRLLQGSFGRKTMRPPLKDVDIVIVLPDRLAGQRSQPGMSEWAMNEFRKAIVDSKLFPGVAFDVEQAHAHALQLSIPGVDFTVDLVPAFETENPDDGWLYIADRDKDEWTKRSDVRRLSNKVSARNQQCGGVWVNQVRQAKHSLDRDPKVKELVCGLLVESLAYEAVTKRMQPQDAMVAIFTAAVDKLSGPYAGLAQDDLTRKWSGADRAQVLRFFKEKLRKAVEAVRLESAGDPVAAVHIWRDVFGDLFPQTDVTFTERLKSIRQVGGAVTSSGLLTTAAGNARPARPWRAVDGNEVATVRPASTRPPVQVSVSMEDLLADPAGVASNVTSGNVIWGAANVEGRQLSKGLAVKLELDLLPVPEAAAEGYGTERVRVVVTRERKVLVYPLSGRGRTWRHRNNVGPEMLCLQYAGDDPALLWLWEDGLGDLLTRVRLHVLSEEVFRREGQWPGEELPHGRPENGVVWPVNSQAMREALKKWSR